MASINACSLSTLLSRGVRILQCVCLCVRTHIIACRYFPNEQNPTRGHNRSLIARELPLASFCPLRLFSLRRIWAYSISAPRPIIWSHLCRVIETFIEMKGIIVVNVPNWRLAPGRDVKPSKGIKKSEVWNAAHSCVMYHAVPLGHLWLGGCGAQLSSPLCCSRGRAQILSTQDTVYPGLMALWNSVFITFKGNGCAVRQPCKSNRGAYAKTFVWV